MVFHKSLSDSKSPHVSRTLLSILANINTYTIILLLWEFFKPAIADGFPQESEWQQVSSRLQDSSQYSSQY